MYKKIQKVKLKKFFKIFLNKIKNFSNKVNIYQNNLILIKNRYIKADKNLNLMMNCKYLIKIKFKFKIFLFEFNI